MEEFKDDFNDESDVEVENFQPEEEAVEQLENQASNVVDDVISDDIPVWNKVEYTPVNKIEDYKPMGKGFKVFCFMMAAVVVLTATTTAGYFLVERAL